MASIKVFKAPKSIVGTTNAPSRINNDNVLKYGYFEELYRLPSSIPIYASVGMGTGAASTYYTVPSGYTLFLTNISVSWIGNSGVAGAIDYLQVLIDNVYIWQRYVFANQPNYNMGANDIVFGIPLRLGQNQALRGSAALGNAAAVISYYGFLVKNI